jgi:hypothetical protein
MRDNFGVSSTNLRTIHLVAFDPKVTGKDRKVRTRVFSGPDDYKTTETKTYVRLNVSVPVFNST